MRPDRPPMKMPDRNVEPLLDGRRQGLCLLQLRRIEIDVRMKIRDLCFRHRRLLKSKLVMRMIGFNIGLAPG